MSLENLTFISGGEDIAAEQAGALESGTLNSIIAKRMGQIAKGHTARADDGISYAEMLRNAQGWYLRPMLERTHGHAVPKELIATAKAAENLAALCWAVADKARRHAARMEAAERAQQEE